MESSHHRWHILGAGAIGSLWASYWQLDQVPVTLVTRSAEGRRTISMNVGVEKHEFTLPCQTTQDIDGPIERLLITTKAHQTLTALRSVEASLSPDAIIIVLQNGMAATELQVTGRQRLYAATTTDGAYFDAQGSLVHAGRGVTDVGPLDPMHQKKTASQPAATELELPSRLQIRCHDDIAPLLWKKLAINCAINPLTVKYQCRNGELLQNAQAIKDLQQICGEITDVTQALNLSAWQGELFEQVKTILNATANNVNSMLQDVRAQRLTEIDYINGYLQRRAEQAGIACPFNRQLISLVRTASQLC